MSRFITSADRAHPDHRHHQRHHRDPAGQRQRHRRYCLGTPTVNPDGSFSIDLYAMSTSDGIQAFDVVVPEPSVNALLALGLLGLVVISRRRKAAAR